MAKKRKRSGGGVISWAKEHPWMTLFLVSSAFAVPAQIIWATKKHAQITPGGVFVDS